MGGRPKCKSEVHRSLIWQILSRLKRSRFSETFQLVNWWGFKYVKTHLENKPKVDVSILSLTRNT